MQRGSASPTEPVVVCPNCGRTAPADAVVCSFCWRQLRNERPSDASRAARAMAVERMLEARDQRARTVAGIRVALLMVLVGFLVWRVQFSGPQALPLPQSTARTLAAPSTSPAGWPVTDGDAGLTRVTNASPRLNGAAAWRARLGSPITTQPIVGEGAVYVGI